MVNLCMDPKTVPVPWTSFCGLRATVPLIAIDGFVPSGPAFASVTRGGTPRLNFNHHDGVSRLETRATCAQALIAIRQGLFSKGGPFADERGHPVAAVYANDCDEDVCLTWFVLSQSHLTGQTINPLLNRLVYMEDMLDTTAGGYPFPSDMPSLQVLNWIFEPYRRFRMIGGLDRRIPTEFAAVVEDVSQRISAYIAGNGKSLDLDTRYEVLSRDGFWAEIREVGMNARVGVYGDGIRAFVTSRQRPDGRWVHTLGRQSIFVPFDVPKILARLNEIESCGNDRYGGGDLIGGSPRVAGSATSPADLVEIVREVLAGK